MMSYDYSSMPMADLKRLEADIKQPPDVWREALAEINRRDQHPRETSPRVATAPARASTAKEVSAVVITGFQVPFWDLVLWLVKSALAAIPAMLILGFIGVFIGTFAAAAIAALGHALHR